MPEVSRDCREVLGGAGLTLLWEMCGAWAPSCSCAVVNINLELMQTWWTSLQVGVEASPAG